MAENREKSITLMLIATVIAIIADILLIFVGGTALSMSGTMARLYPEKVTATVVGYTKAAPYLNVETGKLDGENRKVAVLEIDEGGSKYTVNSFESYDIEPYEIGEQVTLRYDPYNMEVNSIAGEDHFLTDGIAFLSAAAVVTVVTVILVVVMLKKTKAKSL